MQSNKNLNLNYSNPDEKGFTLVRTDIIQLWVWLEGYSPLDDQPLKSLSEDISYRIRETLDSAVNYMRHCKRSKLQTSDLNKAFQFCNIEKTYGYLNKEPFEYNIIKGTENKEKILQNCYKTYLHELKDKKIQLKLPDEEDEETINERNLEASRDIHAKWLIVNGSYIKAESNETSMKNEPDDVVQSDQEVENEFHIKSLNDEYNQFYEMITSIILSQYDTEENDEELFESVLNSLRNNLKLQPVLSHLISFLSQTIQKLTSASMNKTSVAIKVNLFYLQRCIDILKHLIINRNVFLAPKGFFSKIISCLLFCILQNSTMNSNKEGLSFREYSSSVLVLFMKLYQRYSIDTVNYMIKNFLMPHFNDEIENDSQLFSLFGVLCLLKNFGGQMIDEFYPTLFKLVVELDQNQNKFMIKEEVLATCLKCIIVYYDWLVKKHSSNKTDPDYCIQKIYSIYKDAYNLFGDSFINMIKIKNRTTKANQSNDLFTNRSKIKMKQVSCQIKITNDINAKINLYECFEMNENFKLKTKKITLNYGKPVFRA